MDRKCAFTLAEVLITLGIVGVVAAMILPSVITNINERVYSTRQANTAYKVTQATDKMKALGLLNGSYKTTDEFVDELQKHLKIVKRCSANNIADCWPTDKATLLSIYNKKSEYPDLPQENLFWSSTEDGPSGAYEVYFRDGDTFNDTKNAQDGALCLGN